MKAQQGAEMGRGHGLLLIAVDPTVGCPWLRSLCFGFTGRALIWVSEGWGVRSALHCRCKRFCRTNPISGGSVRKECCKFFRPRHYLISKAYPLEVRKKRCNQQTTPEWKISENFRSSTSCILPGTFATTPRPKP